MNVIQIAFWISSDVVFYRLWHFPNQYEWIKQLLKRIYKFNFEQNGYIQKKINLTTLQLFCRFNWMFCTSRCVTTWNRTVYLVRLRMLHSRYTCLRSSFCWYRWKAGIDSYEHLNQHPKQFRTVVRFIFFLKKLLWTIRTKFRGKELRWMLTMNTHVK